MPNRPGRVPISSIACARTTRSPRWLTGPVALVLLIGFVPEASAEIGLDEKLGEAVPLDLEFIDEEGDPVRLGDLVDRPTLLALVYYRCPSVCNVLLSGVADLMDKMDLRPGDDYRVVAISFNEAEKPSVAKQKRDNYFKRMGKPPDPSAWRFLTARAEAIEAITDATGFRYEQVGEEFQHPATLIVLSPKGVIARYLYGVKYLPFDAKMAIYEASQERTGPTISKVLLYCFSYDREGKKYVFNLLKVTGTVTLLFLGGFVGLLVVPPLLRRRASKLENG